MLDLDRLTKLLKENSSVKAFVAANADGQVAGSHNAPDPDTLAGAATLMLLGAATVGATLGLKEPKALRLSARNLEDLLIFGLPGGCTLAVQKTAQASGSELIRTLTARLGSQSNGDGE